MMNIMPLVSVCIPVYNCENFIAESINSVINQNYDNLEIIVIDNNSTDSTFQIVESFGKKLLALKNNINIGMANNWNECILQCKGDYIKILPADDYLYENCISNQIELFLNSEINISIVSSSRHLITSDGKKLLRIGLKDYSKRMYFNKDEILKKCFLNGTNIIGEPGAVLIKMSAIKKTGFFNGDFGYVVDLDYWLRLLNHGSLGYIYEPQVVFRLNEYSDSVRIINKQAKDVIRLFKIHSRTENLINYLFFLYICLIVRLKVMSRILIYKIIF